MTTIVEIFCFVYLKSIVDVVEFLYISLLTKIFWNIWNSAANWSFESGYYQSTVKTILNATSNTHLSAVYGSLNLTDSMAQVYYMNTCDALKRLALLLWNYYTLQQKTVLSYWKTLHVPRCFLKLLGFVLSGTKTNKYITHSRDSSLWQKCLWTWIQIIFSLFQNLCGVFLTTLWGPAFIFSCNTK